MKNVEDFYPLSPMQQGMLFHSLFAPESGVYVEQMSCTLRGDLDVSAFERAWQRVVDRHPILRTAFAGEGLKEPVQVVHRKVQLPVEQQDWRTFPPTEQEACLKSSLQAERERGFDLSKAPLMRLALMRTDDDAYEFIWTNHHILLDGWSIPLLLQEVFAFYESFHQGQDLRLGPPRPYRNYIVWLKRQNMEQAETFWRRTLAGITAPTPLVVDRPLEGVADQKERYDEQKVWLSEETTAALQSLAQQHRLTLNTLVQGAWALLLSRYSGEEDVVFGATVSGRPTDLPESEFMIGLFINTLPVRVRVPPEALVVDWLKGLQVQLVDMRQYEYSPLVDIQGWSDMPRGLPLFESILVFENYPVSATSLQESEGGLVIENLHSVEQTNYPLTVVAGPAEELLLKIAYDCRRFDADTIRRMLVHLGTLLEGFTAGPERSISTLPLLDAAERQRLLVEWNDNAADYPLDRCVHELFEAQVARTPDAVAVVFSQTDHLTYRELNRRANQLAHHLQGLGVGPESLVGICVERSLEMIIAILGTFKAGGAYLPLDPAYPSERLTFMLEDAQVSVLVTQFHLADRLPNLQSPISNPQVIRLDSDWQAIAQENDGNPTSGATPDNLAYVIYTSGSTGRPKGTQLQHRGLCNLAHVLISIFDVEADSRVLQFASFSFDASVAEIFPALLTGATLCMARQNTLASGPALIQLLQDQAITIVTLPPSMLAVLPAEDLPALQTVVSAGEQCPGDIVARWAPGRRFINGYGPTETTVAASYWMVEDTAEEMTSVPIGRPIPNTQIYLLDRYLRPVPVGVPGELHVGGVSLARGYLNRPETTAERFIPDPFTPLYSPPASGGGRGGEGARLYKTGDLARYLPDGNVEFLGRIDHQVKVRGFRIEMGEIEEVLHQHPALQAAVVLAREDEPGRERLVAYVVPEGESAPTVSELRNFLQEKLPEYMIPSAFVTLDALPLTPNGKVDRKALPAPEGGRPEMERVFVAPRDTLELWLTQIWEDVLDVRPVGVRDNFFELGGHSLLAVRLIAQVQKQFGATISMADLFQDPTVARLASILHQQEGGTVPTAILAPIQPEGTKPPLFFVHPSGGSVHWYADLARHLGSDQPFYGIQARGVNGEQEPHTRIEDMAAHYARALREFRPEGPYLLGSWSMGVAVAFEIAQQLYAQGQEVALLAMLDQGPTLPAKEPEDDAAYLMNVFGKQLSLSLEHLRELGPDEQIAYVWEEARKAEWIYPEITLSQFRHFIHMLRAHTEAWRRYEPQVYPGQITLFRASEQSENGSQEPDLGWGRLASGGVEIHEVPGDHLSMIHEPHVQFLTEQMRTCLNKVQAAS